MSDTTKDSICSPGLGQKSPWQSHFHKLEKLFEGDPQLTVKQDGNHTDIHFYAGDEKKLNALEHVLGEGIDFGNVHVKYFYHIANQLGEVTSNDYEVLFEGNKNVSRIVKGGNPVIGQQTYIVFAPSVVQWFDDNLLDVAGNRSTVMEDIAREVFTGSGKAATSFCTVKVG